MPNVILSGRKAILEQMASVRPNTVFKVNGCTLYQSLAAPHDLVSESQQGAYARTNVVRADSVLNINRISETSILYDCQTVGDPELTPRLAALMDITKTWSAQQVQGGAFVQARAIRIEPTSVGWKVLVEVFSQ